MLSSEIKGASQGIDAERVRDARRKSYIAAILSVCPGLGHQYAGHLYRGIFLYVSVIVVSWISAIAFMYVKSKVLSIAILSIPVIAVLLIMIDAINCARGQPSDYKMKWYNSIWIYVAVFAFLFITVNPLMDALIGRHVVRAYLVATKSMYPAILQHDLVVINKLKLPKRGDIVLFGYQDNQQQGSISKIIENETLRRVIAVPEDKVEIRGRKVFVNEREIREPYVISDDRASQNILNDDAYSWGPKTVPADEYFVLSDARQYSFDSRMIGFVKKDRIMGTASKVFWSWNFESGGVRWERTAMSIN